MFTPTYAYSGWASTNSASAPGGAGLPAAALRGVAFAVGWTPGVGPPLAAIHTLSAGAGRRAVSVASASLLVAFGILLIAGQLVETTARLARYTGWQI